MLRTIRIAAAAVFFCGITLLFLDFTGIAHAWLGWMAKVQFLPAILALNVAVVVGLVGLTLAVGRIYCSVVCPLGIMQDIISWCRGRLSKKARLRFRLGGEVSRSIQAVRYAFLVAFVALMAAGASGIALLIAPYSAFGRMAAALLQPLYRMGNNGLALLAERADSYAFYQVEVIWGSMALLAVAGITFLVIFILAWQGGRRYCNTFCPVGTVLGVLSRFAWMKVRIDSSKCTQCGLCARKCKAEAIDFKGHHIDYSRCVDCFDCLDTCAHHALSFGSKTPVQPAANEGETAKDGMSRRAFLGVLGIMGVGLAKAQTDKKVDGGLAIIEDKQIPERRTPIVPPGAQGLRHLQQHCTGCQLCVSACPNGVLRPGTRLEGFMQPTSSYERGYCRPECTRCSEVCPTGAIMRITRAEKAATKIGTARVIEKNCIGCGHCAHKCPVGAITMDDKRPIVDTERCIGCGACENLCPARPFSAIVVDGIEMHREV